MYEVYIMKIDANRTALYIIKINIMFLLLCVYYVYFVLESSKPLSQVVQTPGKLKIESADIDSKFI